MLEHRLGGRDISEVLAMSVTEAGEFFDTGEARTPAAHAILGRLADVGLGYGGRIVFEGTPAALVAARSTLTGEHLAAYVRTAS